MPGSFATAYAHNLNATTDPGANNDASQGYQVGSVWVNTLANRTWDCIANSIGAAVWSFSGAAYAAGGVEPTNVKTQFGSAALGANFGAFFEEGNLYRNCGNPIAGNGADTTDDILDGFVLPANAFDVANRQLMMNFNGKFAANGNNKRLKVWLNPTLAGQTVTNGVISGGTVSGAGSGVLLYDSGVQTGNGVGYQIDVILCKYGATGSNTQQSIASSMFGATHGGTSLPLTPTQPENAAMNIVLTGSSPTTGAANDVVHQYTEINAMN